LKKELTYAMRTAQRVWISVDEPLINQIESTWDSKNTALHLPTELQTHAALAKSRCTLQKLRKTAPPIDFNSLYHRGRSSYGKRP